jgi:nitrogen-specific signal transduction histidine kinase
VEVAVVDDAPGTLTNAMIRGRYIGRGLGLAVDLINRHGGSIRVDARGDGRKAVVVQLPSVEAAPVEVEWTVA